MMEKDEHIVFRKYDRQEEAIITLHVLEQNGIHGFITNENTNNLMPYFQYSICIFVQKSEFLQAHRIVDEYDNVINNELHYKTLAEEISTRKSINYRKIIQLGIVIILFLLVLVFLKKFL